MANIITLNKMNKNFFKKLKVLDGGMGQELHANGLVSKGTLWSTSAVLDEKYHQLIINTHLAFVEAGADVIVTNNFSSRRIRMIQNKVNHLFEFANKKACELALEAKKKSKKEIFIAGSIPAQFDTYKEDVRDNEIISKMRIFAVKNNGHLTIYKAGSNFRRTEEFLTYGDTNLKLLSSRIKKSFDPKLILNPGKMYAGI